MAVDVQAVTKATAQTTTQVSVAHSAAGTNRFTLVQVGYRAGGTNVTMTYDGTAMTKQVSANGGTQRSVLFSLANVSAGRVAIVATFQATATSICIGILGFTSADQTTPLGAIFTESSSLGTDTSASVSAAPGDLALGFINCGDSTISALQASTQFDLVSIDGAVGSHAVCNNQPGDAGIRFFSWGDMAAGTDYLVHGVQVRAIQASAGAAGPYGVAGGRGPTGGQTGVTDPAGSVGDEGVGGETRVD